MNEQAIGRTDIQERITKNYQKKRQNARESERLNPHDHINHIRTVPGDDPDYETNISQGANETRIYGYPSTYPQPI